MNATRPRGSSRFSSGRLSFPGPQRSHLVGHVQAQEFRGRARKEFLLQVLGEGDGLVQSGLLARAGQPGHEFPQQLDLADDVVAALGGHGGKDQWARPAMVSTRAVRNGAPPGRNASWALAACDCSAA